MTVEKVGRAMSWSMVAKVARFAAAPVAYIIIVRSLGEYRWGILSVLRTITGFGFVIVMLGGGNALLKYLPELRVRGGVGTFLGTFKKLLLLQVAVWVALLLAARFSGEALGGFFNERSEHFNLYLQFAVGFVIFEVLMTLTTNILQSWYETRRLSIVIVLGNICYLIFVILFMKLGFGITGILSAGAIVNLGMSLSLVPQILELVKSTEGGGENVPGIRKVLFFSLPFVATGVLNQVVWRHSEVIFLGHYTGVEAAGHFGLAYRIPQLLLEFIPLTIWPIVMAGISEAFARDPGNLRRSIDLYYRLLYILVIPVAAMGFAFARPLVPILFGGEMIAAAPFTQMFFVVFSYSFLYTPLSMALYVMEKSWVNMIVFFFLAVVNVCLDLALIPRYEIWGAFFPVAFVLALGVVVFSFVLRKIRPDVRAPVSFIIRCYAAAVPTCLMAVTSMLWNSYAALAVQIPAGALLLVLGFRWMRVIGENEKNLLRKLPLPWKERLVAIF